MTPLMGGSWAWLPKRSIGRGIGSVRVSSDVGDENISTSFLSRVFAEEVGFAVSLSVTHSGCEA